MIKKKKIKRIKDAVGHTSSVPAVRWTTRAAARRQE